MMAREVMRVVTPGTVVEPRMLEARRNNYLCALVAEDAPDGAPSGGLRFGLAQADLTTGEFAATELSGEEAEAELERELDRLRPAECLVPRPLDGAPSGTEQPGQEETPEGEDGQRAGRRAVQGRNVTPFDPWRFELATAQETLCRLFGVNSLAGFGCDRLPLATRAAGALVAYVEQTHRPLLALLDGLHTYEPARYVRLDGFTRRNLELVEARPSLCPAAPRQGADTAPPGRPSSPSWTRPARPWAGASCGAGWASPCSTWTSCVRATTPSSAWRGTASCGGSCGPCCPGWPTSSA